MAGWLSTAGANALLDGTALPATLYVKLHTGNPGAAGANNAATHTTRVAFTRDAAASGATQNVSDIVFTSLTNTETISHISLWSASSGGTCWGIGALTASKSVTAGDSLTITDSDLDMSFTIWS